MQQTTAVIICVSQRAREELDHTYKYYLEPVFHEAQGRGGELCPFMELIRLVEPSGRGNPGK